ncbi:alpha/beta hydrolase [Paenibacillus cremeus]|uniref:Alpha/beta hydrolase n=1 Tax=Paenibacillus cremeus TaxID=2163881 RepID=A0A559K6Q2_9BACL|nr:alpha/beta hydrolase [Paenibacillus cremeus]TVY07773.1 alpha/beta hydrolase [Paenibacillus cremeus]
MKRLLGEKASLLRLGGLLPVLALSACAGLHLTGSSVIPSASASAQLESAAVSPVVAPVAAEASEPVVELFADQFDDPDSYGSTGGIAVPAPWVQEGKGGNVAKTSASSAAPSLPNMVKLDGLDALSLLLDTTGFRHLKLNYATRASSYTSGCVVVEWSADDGVTWTTLEQFKPPQGQSSEGIKKKSWALSDAADNNAHVKLRFRTEDTVKANLYLDSVSVTGQAIPGVASAATAVRESPDALAATVNKPFNAPKGVKMYEDVEIGTAGKRPLYTSIAVPEVAPDSPMPVVVYIHGGGWNHGGRKDALSAISSYVTKRGYIGVTLDYRLTTEAPFPAQVQDVKLAIRYLRAHAEQYHLNPSRIGVWGSSAGGHLASLLGTTGDLVSGQIDLEGTGGWAEYSDKVQAVADWYGPADFTTDFANKYSSVTALLGGKNARSVSELAKQAMPGTYASASNPPFWIRHGEADSTIPYADSVAFAEQLKAAGVEVVDFKTVPGEGHGFTGDAAAQATKEAWAFMDRYVKNAAVSEPIVYKAELAP